MEGHRAYRLGIIAMAVPLAACSAAKATEAPTSKATSAVTIKTFAFGPKELRVPVGTTVTWTNQDDILHTVTSGTRETDAQGQPTNVQKDGTFDAQLDGVGATTTYKFSKAGTVTYFCDRHPGMDAKVIVG